MSVDYRRAPKGPSSDVVRYRPLGRILPTVINVAIGLFAVAFVFGGVTDATRTDVRCTRHVDRTGTCVITRSSPIFGESSKSVALSSILGTALRTSRSKNTSYYHIVFVTADGDVEISPHGSRDEDERELFEDELGGFLEDQTRISFARTYDRGSPWAVLALLFLLVPMA